MSFVLAIDQGTTSTRAIVFRSDISSPAAAQAEFPQHFPARGWVEHDPEDIWTRRSPPAARRCARPMSRPRTSPPSASPTSARPPWSGTAPPAGRSPRHRLAGPPHRRQLRRTQERGPRARDLGQDRPDPRPLFLGHQDRLAARPRARRARARRARRAGVRHRRLLSVVAAHRRQGARDRRHQRLAHDAVQHPTGEWDDELLKILRVPRSMLPEVKDSAADFGETCRNCSAARSRSPASPATSRPPPSARPASRRA